MAQYTRHPAAPVPTAPEREATGHLMLRAYAVLTMFATLAHTAVFNLLGAVGAVIVLAVLTLGVLAIWIPAIVHQRPARFPWRRLPWAALGYVAFALVSVIWSQWRAATLLTWPLLAAVTVNALFVASMLSWQELVRALSSALKWVLGLSLLIELWVALVLRHPILPNFVTVPEGKIDPHIYWVRGNLFDGGRIQGIVGNAHTLSMMCLLALMVFGVLWAARVRRRGALIAWAALALVLLVGAGSATTYLCALASAAVLLIALLMRRAQRPSHRTAVYAGGAIVVLLAAGAGWLMQDRVLAVFGKSDDFTGRFEIWAKVWERALTHPVAGNGFSSPWVPWDPGFAGWIVNHKLTVFHAHDMWLDVFFQLGAIGVVLMAVAWGALVWRAWFFAVDRPRWDLEARRPYSPLSLLPTMIVVTLLVEGLVESAPIMLWGWMLLIMLSFKIKSVPLVGVGLDERAAATAPGGTIIRAS
ncbi:O-antigen ligase family protein [Microbacterium sp.]|uniref:O-antigen ligase family protein n=1 Tax=Microbacterium sp. TaxID=51671 RepID=UPI00333FD57B